MAEIAVGGIRATLGKKPDEPCSHTETTSVYSAGVQRVICEDCGNLSINLIKGLSVPIDRQRFARPADAVEDAENHDRSRAVFAVDGAFGLRSRFPLINA